MARIDDLERAAFERDLLRPPHTARMLEHAGRYVGGLDKADRAALLGCALERLFEQRAKVHATADVLRAWLEALDFAARSRPRWKVHYNVYQSRWVKRLGRG